MRPSLLLWFCTTTAIAQAPFFVEVVDQATERGVPLVETLEVVASAVSPR